MPAVATIASVDAIATRITGDYSWVNNAALLLDAYCNELLDDKGLLPHTAGVPFYWGRGIGWVAAGLTEALTTMKKDHPLYPKVLAHYRKLMAGLLPHQGESGLWYQLLDDKGEDNWEETSCTGMFAYSYMMGIKYGWLDEKTYGAPARKAWLKLCDMIDEEGRVKDVCVGTNEEHGRAAYIARKRKLGDFHGQAPILWCVNALLLDSQK